AIGLVLPDEGRTVHDPYFGRVVSGVLPVIRPLGVQLVLTTGDHREVVDDIRQRRLDGVILIHTHGADPLPRQLIEANLPVVLAARPVRPMAITYVDVDQAAGAGLAADHLVAAGCRRLATVTGPLETPAGQDRLRGFLDAVAAHGLPEPVVVEGDFSREGGADAGRRLAGTDVDGVFVASDLMATGVLPVLRNAGRRVPEDVKVVGFDDSSPAVECDPPLTTVRQPVEDMAAEMARLLVQRVERPDRPVSSVVFAPTLVVRRSS
ncbi:MAG: substrate-binding domain-containing protein, partial [Saccharothrix sp.]|nr:substrate-binding domain-containing protein [Saccharothrix sp.]